MVSDSNCWLIAADWRQYFFIKYRNLPPETIGVPPLARAIVPSGTARKATGDLRRLRPVGQTAAGLVVILDFRRPLSRGRWIPGRKAAGDLRRLRPVGQTGLRVEVILRLPEAALQGASAVPQARRARGTEDGRHQAFHRTFPGTPGEWPPEVLESLQPEAQSAWQATTAGGPPLLFVRVSTPTSPQNYNLCTEAATCKARSSPIFYRKQSIKKYPTHLKILPV